MVLTRCYICGSTNIVKHHDALPRWSVKRTKEGGVVKECKRCTWYICKDCGFKLFEDVKVPERYCGKKKKS